MVGQFLSLFSKWILIYSHKLMMQMWVHAFLWQIIYSLCCYSTHTPETHMNMKHVYICFEQCLVCIYSCVYVFAEHGGIVESISETILNINANILNLYINIFDCVTISYCANSIKESCVGKDLLSANVYVRVYLSTYDWDDTRAIDLTNRFTRTRRHEYIIYDCSSVHMCTEYIYIKHTHMYTHMHMTRVDVPICNMIASSGTNAHKNIILKNNSFYICWVWDNFFIKFNHCYILFQR